MFQPTLQARRKLFQPNLVRQALSLGAILHFNPPMTSSRWTRRAVLAGAAWGAGGAWITSARAELPGTLLELAARPENYEAPLTAFTQKITPLESFYIRSHYDRPAVDPKTWALSLDGLVKRPLKLDLKALAKFPQAEIEAVLQCSGNGRALFRPRMPGVQWQKGAMGNAVWGGVRLKDILAKLDIDPKAQNLILTGADRPVLPQAPAFIRSIPLQKALHPDTLVATHMNGVPLPPAQGGPARLVVPGWVGDDWVKWLSQLTLSEHEAKGFFFEKAYRYPDPPGAPGEKVPPENMKVMTQLNVKSVIAQPGPGPRPAGPLEVIGVAFSHGAEVTRVDISLDGGATWKPAQFPEPATTYGWRIWKFNTTLATGKVVILSRATDATGAVQPMAPIWNPSGYLHNAIDRVELEVRA